MRFGLYSQRRKEIHRQLDQTDHFADDSRSIGWNVPDAQGTMFVWAKTPRGWEDDEAFVTELFKRTGILVTPGSAFASRGKGHVRFALVQPAEALADCAARLQTSGFLG